MGVQLHKVFKRDFSISLQRIPTDGVTWMIMCMRKCIQTGMDRVRWKQLTLRVIQPDNSARLPVTLRWNEIIPYERHRLNDPSRCDEMKSFAHKRHSPVFQYIYVWMRNTNSPCIAKDETNSNVSLIYISTKKSCN